jgi:3-oxoacyl-[acyl-carrier protein] reductase
MARVSDGPANEVVTQIERGGGTAVGSARDVSDREGPEALVDLALERFGRVDVLLTTSASGPFGDGAARPKLRVLEMPRLVLACAFAPSLAAVSGYFRRVSGMVAPMRSKAAAE